MCNILCKFLIKIESTWRRRITKQTPQLTLLCCGRTVRSSHRRCSMKSAVLQNFAISLENFCVGVFFEKVAGLKACNFIQKRPQHMSFPVNIAKFLRLLILKNFCERLLFYCFNGLQFTDGSRSRFCEDVRLHRLHGPSCRSFSVFKSPSLPWTDSRPGFENLRWIPLINQLSFYIGYFWSF